MDREVAQEDLIGYTDGSVYKLVNVLSQRAHQIAEKSKNVTSENKDVKPVSAAIEEMLKGNIKLRKIKES